MARTVTALDGQHKSSQQIPVSLIYLNIPSPWGPLAIHDLDEPLYLDRTTNELSMLPGGSRTLFLPYADLSVPRIEYTDESIYSDVSIRVSNVNEYFFAVLAAGTYRDAITDIWQGNLILTNGYSPDDVEAEGVIKVYTGRIDFISANVAAAEIRLQPHITPFTQKLPHRLYSPTQFKRIPAPNTKLHWGWTSRVF